MRVSSQLAARPFVLRPITLREGNAFVAKWHRHSLAVVREGGRVAVGAVCDGELVGVGISARPVNAQLAADPHTAEIVRVCTSPDAPLNVCSKIYRALWDQWRAIGGQRIVTYTLSTETGASLRAAGLTAVTKVRPHEWNRVGRPRKDQRLYHLEKVRWELRAVTKGAR